MNSIVNECVDKPALSDFEERMQSTFFNMIENGDYEGLKKILTSSDISKIRFWLFKDKEKNTVLVKASFLCMTDLALKFSDEAKKRLMDDYPTFTQWLNCQNHNGFNSIHYGAFRGNIKLIEHLLDFGADINIKNHNGLNVMHLAAQGDQPCALVYFKDKCNLKPIVIDNVQSTPLHWAAYMGAEICVDYLLSWGVDINAKDKDGFTPLHLAVMMEKTKTVKKLIKLGAEIDICDNKNRKPIDIAMYKNNQIIIDVLKSDVNFCTCNFNQHKAENSNEYPIVFFVYFTLMELVSYVLILPHCNSNVKYHIEMGLMLLLLLAYIKLGLSDPGWIKIKLTKSLQKMVTDGDMMSSVCPWCINYMNTYTKHCYNCNKCVDSFDHHCIWVKNCIGKKNMRWFFIFITLILIKLIVNISFAFEVLFSQANAVPLNTFPFNHFSGLYNEKIKKVSTCVEIIFGLIVVIPIICLLLTHLKKLDENGGKKREPCGNLNSNDEEFSVVLMK